MLTHHISCKILVIWRTAENEHRGLYKIIALRFEFYTPEWQNIQNNVQNYLNFPWTFPLLLYFHLFIKCLRKSLVSWPYRSGSLFRPGPCRVGVESRGRMPLSCSTATVFSPLRWWLLNWPSDDVGSKSHEQLLYVVESVLFLSVPQVPVKADSPVSPVLVCDQPIKLGDHLNSILLGMCEDVIYARVSVRTVLDACSAHVRNSNCAPSFSYVKQLVRLVLGSLSGVSLCQCLRK